MIHSPSFGSLQLSSYDCGLTLGSLWLEQLAASVSDQVKLQMRISSVSIRNFRSLASVDLKKCGSVNTLIGKNKGPIYEFDLTQE
jgi:hypothetical protein